MANTERLFYSRPELLEAEARVIAVGGSPDRPLLELDRSIFYPEGGGQPCDLGSLSIIGPGGALEAADLASVDEERRAAGGPDTGTRILHALAGPLPAKAGDMLLLRLDAERRLDYSQAHTGQHLISSTFLRLFGAATVSVHLSRERSSIDFDLAALPEEDLAEAEDAIERAIAEDRPIRVHLCPPEDPEAFPLRKRPPAGEDELRIVEIDGLDFTPCCGTHLSSTGRLRVLRILGTEKYKGMTRLYFLAGARAAADYRSVSRIAQDAARALGASVPELSAAAAREAERRKALEFAVTGLVRERAAAEAREASAEPSSLVSRSYSDRDAASLMESAKAFAAVGLTALLASIPDLTVQALSPSPGARLGERLKPLLAGGKGGGGGSSFRAAFADAGALAAFMDAAERELAALE